MSARRLERVILATEFGFRSIKLIELRASSTCRVADDFVKRFLPSFKYHNASLEFKYTSVDEAKGSKKPQQKDGQQGEGSALPEGLDVHKDVVIIDFNDNHRQVLGLHLYPQASLLAQRILRLDRERDILQRIEIGRGIAAESRTPLGADGRGERRRKNARDGVTDRSGSGAKSGVRESTGERFERKVKRRLEEEINRRVEDGLKDEKFQKEMGQAVDEARSGARKKMLEEVEAEKVSIQKEFDKKLEAAKEPASRNESTVEDASSVSVTKVQESEAEALRKEKKLERLRRIAEEREKRMQSGLSPKQAPAAATSSRTKSNSGPSISFSLKKPGR
ncbi:hypothetical protein FOZ61_009503 [Perkinsus olseni]|uniref:Uncharacterized protein n=1 Tax=Perkinsus olseni TaxID=32597 RepID=A0A7J6MHI5_PEROL|nr:hypothetical protein FOZ61_009503 [Perkinsus olseni]